LIAVDTNILIYAHRKDSEWHERAEECVRSLADGHEPWAVPWPCIHEFIAVVTNLRIYKPPTTIDGAIEQVEIWLESPSLRLIGETKSYWEDLKDMVVRSKTRGSAVHDARIAAICQHHGVQELWTADRDFLKFPDLKFRNPLLS
jgi:uncharacterized protein